MFQVTTINEFNTQFLGVVGINVLLFADTLLCREEEGGKDLIGEDLKTKQTVLGVVCVALQRYPHTQREPLCAKQIECASSSSSPGKEGGKRKKVEEIQISFLPLLPLLLPVLSSLSLSLPLFLEEEGRSKVSIRSVGGIGTHRI